MSEKNPDNFFFVKSEMAIRALDYWLQEREYNMFVESTDKKDQQLRGLIFERNGSRQKKGIICIGDEKFLQPVMDKINEHMTDKDA